MCIYIYMYTSKVVPAGAIERLLCRATPSHQVE